MAFEVYLDDAVIVQRRFELPESCPQCGHKFVLGEAQFKSRHLWPREELLMLSTLLDGTAKREVVSVKDPIPFTPPAGRFMELCCLRCNFVLASAHTRTWLLDAMDRMLAFKLRTILYDSNVKDPAVKKKCFDETEGYHGDCLECNIEAEIGTEEVPHPIDARVHSCNKSSA